MTENRAITKGPFCDYSNEIGEIISREPSFIVKRGTLFYFIFIIALLVICSFIRYPEIINVDARLTSINAPKEVKVRIAGKLEELMATEGSEVTQGQLLGVVESRANPEEILLLSNITDSLQTLVDLKEMEHISAFITRSFQHLGEIQQDYQIFMQAFSIFRQYLVHGYYLRKKAMLEWDIKYLQHLHSYLSDQKGIQEEDLRLADTSFKMNLKLKEESVIAEKEYREERSKYLAKALSIPQINTAISNNESSQHEKEKEILQLENDISQQKGVFTQTLNTLKYQLEDWKSKYLLVAPTAGTVTFATFLQEAQQLEVNQTICFINPKNSTYFAQVLIPQYNFGKISVGQKVLLKLSSYPFEEYGAIQGKIDFISHIPTDSGNYLAKVSLPGGLHTNFRKDVQFREGLLGQAEIITNQMSLLKRLFYSFSRFF